MATFEPLTGPVDNVTDRGKIERIKLSGAGDSSEETEWIYQIIVSASAPSDPGIESFWWDPAGVLSVWDTTASQWIGVTGVPDLTEFLGFALSDETTDLTTGTAKITFRMPFAGTLTAVRASLATVSSSGVVTVDINKNGTTMLSTKLTIDASEETSATAAAAAVISVSSLALDDEVTMDIDTAGTGAKGLKVWLTITRTP